MCFDPITLATFAASAASTVAGFVGQQQQAKAAQANAIKANDNTQNALTLRQVQEQDKTAQQLQQKSIAEAEKRSEVEVQAAAGNVSGASIDNILTDVSRKAATDRTALRTNYNAAAEQLQMEKQSSKAQAEGRIAANPSPSPLSLVAGLATNALGAYNDQKRREALDGED